MLSKAGLDCLQELSSLLDTGVPGPTKPRRGALCRPLTRRARCAGLDRQELELLVELVLDGAHPEVGQPGTGLAWPALRATRPRSHPPAAQALAALVKVLKDEARKAAQPVGAPQGAQQPAWHAAF